ncbi:MAG: hypothetical protein U0271_02260 [Polyangiaceae bacterium]
MTAPQPPYPPQQGWGPPPGAPGAPAWGPQPGPPPPRLQPPPPRKSPVFPIIAAVVLLPPGALTYMFAWREATRLTSDWVYISMPLLTLGGLSVVWALARLLKVPGIVIGGGLFGIGLASALFLLNEEATKRRNYQESAQAVRETEGFCRGKGKPNRRAPEYDPKRSGRHSTVTYAETSFGSASYVDSEKYRSLMDDKYQIEATELVLCLKERDVDVGSCAYSGGVNLILSRRDTDLKLYSIRSGDLVFEKTFEGGPPRPCQTMEKFYGTGDNHTYGDPVTAEVILDAVKAFTSTK